MSWIFGFIGASLSRSRREGLAAFHPKGTVYRGASYYVAVGGPAATTRHGRHGNGGWAVCGLGLRVGTDATTLLDAADWRRLLAFPAPPLDTLDGHFVAARWTEGHAELFADPLGVRTLYLTTLPDGVAFGTRPIDLARLAGGTVDLETFGAHWLTFNLLAPLSPIRGLTRLGPGGHARCTPDRFTLSAKPWTPLETPGDPDAFRRTLQALLRPHLPAGRTTSLGLSGGLDSRLLLALLPPGTWQAHTFGPPDHPDVRVARRLAAAAGLPHRHLCEPVPDAETCLTLLREHAALTHVISPASTALGGRYYARLARDEAFLIDGGFGEVARRQFFNRLLRRGRPALRHRTPGETILRFLRVERADVFTPEAIAQMEAGALRQLAATWHTLPPAETLGPEAFLDLLGVRTRLPNFFGFEQNRLDALLPGYMPFAQPSLLRAVFQIPLRLRKNGRLFRRLIRDAAPALTRYPLVKGDQPYPFSLPTVPAILWTRARARLRPGPGDPVRRAFLDVMRPFALEAALEASRHFPAYDARKLQVLVESYYAGKEHLAGAVDWWLAFEVWRREVEPPR
ncbi:hypothetical protein GQ464_001775 [Rhodocaloribacter litoris]|uniref:asparagine synthase-related protein n=1 Tax=Rhodocaloribacter litoris TaxID=2558931 RepID=UPI001420F3EE|nr:asparagine synthase-related protein [Rhodocaloribacter litoris]QXD15698.1 hypothetical protein GQ464_001775 [Rhodocaloribacter litoris]